MKPVAESLGSEACSLELWVMEQGAWNRWASKPRACGLKAEVELEACNVEYISECVSRVVVRAYELFTRGILKFRFMNNNYHYYY